MVATERVLKREVHDLADGLFFAFLGPPERYEMVEWNSDQRSNFGRKNQKGEGLCVGMTQS
jgi:hypothetical protein